MSDPLVPGLNLIGYGYDAFSAPYCDQNWRKGDDGDALVTGLTLQDPGSRVSVLGGHFFCPLSIKVLTEQQKNDDYTQFASSVEEYTSQLTVTAGVSADVCGFSASVQSKYQSSTSSYTQNVYAEHGHVESGITVVLPLDAARLRAQLKPSVKSYLESHSAQDVLQKYGTHLVTGVMIGGKSFMRQYSSRSDVTNSTDWSLAVKASYDGVTASGSVDVNTSSMQKTFKMAIDVQTLGGSGIVIHGNQKDTGEQFQRWLDSLNGNPAIIDMTALVPLWNLLPPESPARMPLQKAIINRARLFQPGALFGARQDYTNLSSSDPLKSESLFGSEAGRPVTAGWGQCWADNDKRFGAANLFLNTGQEDLSYKRLAIYGGHQMASKNTSSEPFQEMNKWGRQTNSKGSLETIQVFNGFVNGGPYGDGGYSNVSLFVGPIEEAEGVCWVVRGGYMQFDDGAKTAAWGLSPETTNMNLAPQKIFSCISWGENDWKSCSTYWYLHPVLSNLNDIA